MKRTKQLRVNEHLWHGVQLRCNRVQAERLDLDLRDAVKLKTTKDLKPCKTELWNALRDSIKVFGIAWETVKDRIYWSINLWEDISDET